MARFARTAVPDFDEDVHQELSNGNYGGLPQDVMNNLSLHTGAGTDTNGAYRGSDHGPEDGEGSDAYEPNPLQRRLSLLHGDHALPPEYKLLHRVLCDHRRADGEDHQDHPEQADYLDVPRLIENDTRGSALRGVKPLINPQEYWDDHPEICAVVTREYHCGIYHRKLKESFQLIDTGIDRHVFNRLRPWFFRLRANGPPAVSAGETIMISQNLSMSLMTLIGRNQLGEWDQERNLKAPYDYFYHFRHDLRDHSEQELTPPERQELEVLLDYIDLTQGEKFDKVDAMFESGVVHRDLFSKLFRPNDMVVTMQEGHPRAYLAEKIYVNDRRSALDRQSITLDCWTWDFDGSFRKKTSQLQVPWPPYNPPTVPITGLPAWPLRLDKSNMRERLEKRGRYFWQCRYKQLVSYSAPSPTIF